MFLFYKNWLKTALLHKYAVFGQWDLWAGLISTLAPIFEHFFPASKPVMEANSWVIPVLIFGAVILIRLILSPYWIWNDQNSKIIELEAKFNLKLPNYEVWDTHNDFEIWKAAYLMQDKEPSTIRINDEFVLRNYNDLVRDIKARKIDVNKGFLNEYLKDDFDEANAKDVVVNPKWKITRSNLLTYCLQLDIEPPFIFERRRVFPLDLN